ncbi:MAG TPA: helicase-related protein [Pyrinomonadaceae bacterium]|nr:helicase-related protein [Pyrinomonadaceae bacterium]
MQNYRRELFRLDAGDESQLLKRKLELEAKLRSVMVRTEKLASSADRAGMLKQVPPSSARLNASDLRTYLSLQGIAKVLNQADTLEYWKSSPYLLNFMEAYKIKDSFNESVQLNIASRELAEIISRSGSMLNWRAIRDYKHIDPANARMRVLLDDMIGKGAWRLLWIPPSLPYYQFGFPFSNPELAGLTKRLVFSSWRVAPRAIACLLSYEAERLAIRSLDKRPLNTAEARKRRKGLLRFNRTEGRLAGMPVLGVLYPCKTLAFECDPLKFLSASEELETLPRVVKAISRRISELLTQIIPAQDDQAVNESWYWAAPILLDLKSDRNATRQWLELDQLAERWSGAGNISEDGEDSLWAEHVLEAQKLLTTPSALGKPPSDLADVLALMSLGGPGITALRSLARLSNSRVSPDIRTSAASVAWSFRHLYNMPEAMAMIRAMPGPTKDQPYWRRILEYGANGCLQSTMDEYVHVLRESLGLLDSPAEITCEKIAQAMVDALSLRVSAMGVDNIDADASGTGIEVRKERLRGHFAVRFGDEKTADVKEVSRAEQVRESFNSPFWPFVLATTSVGQEGLDFHHYCHAVVHWNLPSNPVDLEQREGRVHRYKGHAVRKNLAKRHGRQAISDVGIDPWERMFAEAKRHRDPGVSDIVPFWVFQTEGGARIERHVPAIPLSAEQMQLADLTKSLVVYRMVFGQNAQEDLTSYLLSNLPADQVEKISAEARICLEPL